MEGVSVTQQLQKCDMKSPDWIQGNVYLQRDLYFKLPKKKSYWLCNSLDQQGYWHRNSSAVYHRGHLQDKNRKHYFQKKLSIFLLYIWYNKNVFFKRPCKQFSKLLNPHIFPFPNYSSSIGVWADLLAHNCQEQIP